MAAGNLPNNLEYLKATLRVHLEAGTALGTLDNDNDTVTQIYLTNNAVVIHGSSYEII